MTNSVRRFKTSMSFAVAAVAVFLLSRVSAAQQDVDAAYIAAVKGIDVYVRSGAAESYYPFAKVNDGDLVKVTGEKFDWVRVSTVGPAFVNTFGYVKYLKTDNGRFRLAPDGKTGVTLGKTDIIAPNLDAKGNPKDSWKSIIRLEADQTLRVLKTTQTEKDMIHEVALPASAQGWISKAYVERASEEQASQWAQVTSPKPMVESKPSSDNLTNSPPNSPTNAKSESVKTEPVKTELATPATEQSPETKQLVEPAGSEDTSALPDEDETNASTSEVAESDAPPALAFVKPAEPKLPTLDDLEAAYKRLQKEPAETAELAPLRELYLDLAHRSVTDQRIARRAAGRAEQLQIWSDLQKKRHELDAIRNRTKLSAQEAEAVRQALESSAQYVAVGRIVTSTIYDGERLPKLLRLQDASTSRTVAYLMPDEEYELVNLIGNIVGVVGEKAYDETLRLNIVTPKRIDLLIPEQRETAAAKTD